MTACDIMVGKKDGRKMKMEMTMPRCFQNKNCVRNKRPCIIYRYIHESWGFRLTNLFFRGRIGLWVIRRWLSNFCFSADLTFKFGSEAEIITTDQSHTHTQPQIKHWATNDGGVQRYDVIGDLRVHFATENQQIWRTFAIVS